MPANITISFLYGSLGAYNVKKINVRLCYLALIACFGSFVVFS